MAASIRIRHAAQALVPPPDTDGWRAPLARYPEATLTVLAAGGETLLRHNLRILPAAARERIVSAQETGRPADFILASLSGPKFPASPPSLGVLHARRIYGNTVLTVKAVELSEPSLADEEAAARAAYRAAAAGEPLFRSAAFDLHLDGRTLTWVVESCRPEDTGQTLLLDVVPVVPDDLPNFRDRGWLARGFGFGQFGVRFDGRCLARRTLPDFPIRALRVGRRWREGGEPRREATTIDLSAARRR